MSTGQQRNERVIRVGVIGLGGAAVGMLAKFTKAPRFQVTAVADIDPEILARFHADSPETALFNSADDLCTQGEVDLVYISTPTHWHVEHARAAMSNGKHVLTEKPLALSLEDADAIIADSARYGVLLGVNVPISFEPLAQKLREVVVSGEFGKLRMVHHWRYHDWLYRPRSSGELTPEVGSGLLWRDGPHQLDLLRTIAGGLVRSVRGYVGMWDAERRVPGAYVAYIDFEDGTVVTAVNNGYDHFQSSEFVFGSDEGVSLRGGPPGTPRPRRGRGVGERRGEGGAFWRDSRRRPLLRQKRTAGRGLDPRRPAGRELRPRRRADVRDGARRCTGTTVVPRFPFPTPIWTAGTAASTTSTTLSSRAGLSTRMARGARRRSSSSWASRNRASSGGRSSSPTRRRSSTPSPVREPYAVPQLTAASSDLGCASPARIRP